MPDVDDSAWKKQDKISPMDLAKVIGHCIQRY